MKYYHFVTFLDCPVLTFFLDPAPMQVEPLDRFSRFVAQKTCFRARKCLLEVRTMGLTRCYKTERFLYIYHRQRSSAAVVRPMQSEWEKWEIRPPVKS